MASQNPYPPQNNASFPALHLYPLDDSFIPKRIALGGGQRVKIARPPNTKTQPGERNGYFDSRVLSRQHAEVWEENGKIFIKDIKSANGTFINGERLSPEGRESDVFELKNDDILEFGVDIVSEDGKTVLHRKVVARVACVLGGKNGNGGPPPPGPYDQFATMNQAATAAFNGMSTQRRPQVPMIHQGLAGLGGMGGGVRAPGRGLTLDHIFSRLQAELAKSRDTGHDLQVLTGALNNIEETLNGTMPGTGPPQFPEKLPPVRPPPPERSMSVPALPQVPSVAPSPTVPTDPVAELQLQLRKHQDALSAHIEGIRALEGVLAEQETMKREVRELREFMGVDRDRIDVKPEGEMELEMSAGEDDDDDSDTQSIMTAVPHELDVVEEEAEEDLLEQGESPLMEEEGHFDEVSLSSAQDDAAALQEEREENMLRERAQTPEPTDSPSPPSTPAPPMAAIPLEPETILVQSPPPSSSSSPSTALSLGELTARLALLTTQLESALAASTTLQAQHASAQATIATLEEKIARLEATSASPPPPVSPVEVISPPPAAATTPPPEIEEMQAQLASLRAELTLERGRREAWADGVEARMLRERGAADKAESANGKVEELEAGQVRRRRGRSASQQSRSSRNASRRRSKSPVSAMDDSMRLEQLELGDLRGLKLVAGSASSVGENPGKLLRPSEAGQMHPSLNTQAAIGVLVLGLAAAAVLWRVKPE
ncbi:FHA domain-containing protein [Favolaschia claudopus]|uniref:FHA domain-containing protein n=1 Tax=Favolaschia claudopus TaxID=2862362 RepID=A0AAW0DN40_9AGAR